MILHSVRSQLKRLMKYVAAWLNLKGDSVPWMKMREKKTGVDHISSSSVITQNSSEDFPRKSKDFSEDFYFLLAFVLMTL